MVILVKTNIFFFHWLSQDMSVIIHVHKSQNYVVFVVPLLNSSQKQPVDSLNLNLDILMKLIFNLFANVYCQVLVLWIEDNALPVVFSNGVAMIVMPNSVAEHRLPVEGHVEDANHSSFLKPYNVFWFSANLEPDFNASLLNEKDFIHLLNSME